MKGGIFNLTYSLPESALQVKALCLYAHTYLDICIHIDKIAF